VAQEQVLEVSFPVNQTTLFAGVIINGNTYNYTPTPINSTTQPSITTWLSSLGYGYFSFDLYDGSNQSIAEIYSDCTTAINTIPSYVILNEGQSIYNIIFDNFDCDYGNCAPLVIKGHLNIDCNNLSVLTFTDTTGAYSPTNTGGYGSPNYPAYNQIVGTLFDLLNSQGTLIGEINGGFVPDANNTPHQINVSAFGISALTPGSLYYLVYKVQCNNSTVLDCLKIPFYAPCCGNPLSTNLGTSFNLVENTGCSSITFTDTTGVYNASTNPGGYGTPNPNYSDISYTLITITLENGQVIEISDFVPTESVPYFTIPAITLGYDGVIPDQVITVDYQIFNEADCQIGSASYPVLLSCQTAMCLQAARSKMLGMQNTCNGNPYVDEVVYMVVEYQNIQNAVNSNAGCITGLIQNLLYKCQQNCNGGCR
jgi:hypothetical protein